MQESVPPGPAFCWPPPPLPSGQPPREPRTAVGRAVKYIREGVLAVAAEVDGDAAYDAENYYEGKFSIDSVLSQKVTVPDGCLLMELMDYMIPMLRALSYSDQWRELQHKKMRAGRNSAGYSCHRICSLQSLDESLDWERCSHGLMRGGCV